MEQDFLSELNHHQTVCFGYLTETLVYPCACVHLIFKVQKFHSFMPARDEYTCKGYT